MIHQDDSTVLTGSSSAISATIQSTESVSDENSELRIETEARFRAIDVVIGDLETDCFELLAGEAGLFVDAMTESHVVLGC